MLEANSGPCLTVMGHWTGRRGGTGKTRTLHALKACDLATARTEGSKKPWQLVRETGMRWSLNAAATTAHGHLMGLGAAGREHQQAS